LFFIFLLKAFDPLPPSKEQAYSAQQDVSRNPKYIKRLPIELIL